MNLMADTMFSNPYSSDFDRIFQICPEDGFYINNMISFSPDKF